jgi:D-serine deaminase-like pyridoxal phosphate-dependent protein
MHSTTFKKILASAIVLSLIGLSGSQVLAANKEGAKCTTAGKIVTVSGKKLVCAKAAKTLKWVAVGGKAVTTTTAAPTTTVAATTTTTTVAAAAKPVVTLLRAGGTSTSASVSYTVTGDKDLSCTTLSTVLGVDFNGTRISRINSIVQTSAKVCTVNAQSIAERDNDTRETILAAATTFSIADTAGLVQTVLLGSPQSIWVTRAP